MKPEFAPAGSTHFPLNTNDLALVRLLARDWEAQAPAPALDALDWTDLVRKALHHGVGGLLCRALRDFPDAGIPDDILEAARLYLDRADIEGMERVRQTFDVLDALAADDVPALPFKGVALAAMAHASPAMRPSRDIDVLVHRADMARSVASLATLGYRPQDTFSTRITRASHASYGQDILFAKGRLPVEPHWAFAPSAFAVDPDLDGMRRRTVTIPLGGRVVRTLSLEDTLLVACLHGAKEKWWRLLWVADVAALVHRHPALDWSAIAQRAAEAGMLRILRLGLGLARALFSVRLPEDLADAIERDEACRCLIDDCRRRIFEDTGNRGSLFHVSRFHWGARERMRDRIRYAWRTVTTPRDIHFRMIALPDALVFGYVPLKLVHDYLLLPLWRLGNGRWSRKTRADVGIEGR